MCEFLFYLFFRILWFALELYWAEFWLKLFLSVYKHRENYSNGSFRLKIMCSFYQIAFLLIGYGKNTLMGEKLLIWNFIISSKIFLFSISCPSLSPCSHCLFIVWGSHVLCMFGLHVDLFELWIDWFQNTMIFTCKERKWILICFNLWFHFLQRENDILVILWSSWAIPLWVAIFKILLILLPCRIDWLGRLQ